jgi:hypothetical protein
MANATTVLAVLASFLLGACSSQPAKPSPEAAPPDAGSSFFLPDASIGCSGSSTPAQVTDAADPLCTSALPHVSYANDVLPILSQCSGEVCHPSWDYGNSVNQHSLACCDHRWLVLPGQPSASHVIQAVRGVGACVPQMPDNGALPESSVTTLIAWVCQGATTN